jgi:DNA-nicking Smr family endonuclease
VSKCRKEEMDEKELFSQAMLGVERISTKGRDVQPQVEPKSLPPQKDGDPLRDFMEGKIEFSLEFTNEFIEGHVLGLDSKTINKLRAGQFSPEAHIDLHGLSAEAARDAMLVFFRSAYHKGLRTVLLVPGRGLNSPNGLGVLRIRVQEWLTQDPLKRVVLAFCTAQPRHGGAGALYVLLRKFRKSNGKIRWDRVPDA